MVLLWKCFTILIFSLGTVSQAAKVAKEAPLKFTKSKIQVGIKIIEVDLAETEAQHNHGLMYRKSLLPDEGMLFVFREEKVLYFWMKNTFLDLSIGFFDKNMVLVDVQEMKATSVLEANPPTYPSAKPASYALEMNKSWFSKNKVKVGQKLKFLDR